MVPPGLPSLSLDEPALAAALLAIAPAELGGAVLRCGHGPERDAFLQAVRCSLSPDTPWLKVPCNVTDDRLLGGLDLARTLAQGQPVVEPGVLARADRGVVLMAMAERWDTPTTLKLCMVLDRGEVHLEREGLSMRLASRFSVIALDEGVSPDEAVAPALLDRLAFLLPLTAWAPIDPVPAGDAKAVAAKRRRFLETVLGPEQIRLLVETHTALGIASMRAVSLAAVAARAAAALDGEAKVLPAHLELAVRMVLLPRATVLPVGENAEDQQSAPPPPSESDQMDAESPPPEPEPPSAPEVEHAQTPESLPEPEPPATDRLEPPTPEQQASVEARADEVLAAAMSALPAGLLALFEQRNERARRMRSADRGRMGQRIRATQQGRSRGARPGDPRNGGRLSVSATLRASAPWQRLRSMEADASTPIGTGLNDDLSTGPNTGKSTDDSTHTNIATGTATGTGTGTSPNAGVHAVQPALPARRRPVIRPQDFHVHAFEQRSVNNILFVVDASGSQAMNRMAEAKGAVETLLADCYARRDRVALIAFRRREAELLLPPTRSLVAAKKRLARLPGGGGTPLALALKRTCEVATDLSRRGERVQVVLLTDGRGNVTLDGVGDPTRAQAEVEAAARGVANAGLEVLFIDSSPRPRPIAAELAQLLCAQYLPLPRGVAGGVGQIVQRSLRSPG